MKMLMKNVGPNKYTHRIGFTHIHTHCPIGLNLIHSSFAASVLVCFENASNK